jgi:hypothetical protein
MKNDNSSCGWDGGGIGSQIVSLLRQDLPPEVKIYALGRSIFPIQS